YLIPFYLFFMSKTLSLNLTVRPGETLFSGLISPQLKNQIHGFWGFHKNNLVTSIMTATLTCMAVSGLWRLIKIKQIDLIITFFVFSALVLIMIGKFHYSYGAYKFIILYWWLLLFIVLLTVEQ